MELIDDLYAHYWHTEPDQEPTWPLAPLALEMEACFWTWGPYAGTHGLSAWDLFCKRRGDGTVTEEVRELFRALCAREEKVTYTRYNGVDITKGRD